MKYLIHLTLLITIVGVASSCRSYKQNVLFRTKGNINFDKLETERLVAQQNYRISNGDRLRIEVFTNKGERIIDPDFQLLEGMNVNPNMLTRRATPDYMVEETGFVKLPMVGSVKVSNLTLRETEKILEKEYDNHYKDCFVNVRYINKRVVILGAVQGLIVPLENENTNLIEVLAQAGGLPNNARGNNIRLIRGDLSNPEVQVIDLTTIEGMKKASLKVQSGDIIYVEPIRRTVPESLKDYGPIIGIASNVVTLALVIATLL